MQNFFHHIQNEFRELDSSAKKLRSFGLFVGGTVLFIVSILTLIFRKDVPDIIPLIGLTLVGFAFLYPTLLKYPYYVWMGIAIVLGSVIAPIVLCMLFFLLLTPLGLLKRLFGVAKKAKQETYWRPHEGSQDPKKMEELF